MQTYSGKKHEVSDMKVEFDEIKGLTPHIWTEGREWMWMEKVTNS